MANLTETATFDAGVYQIETTDLVLGGAGAIANGQAQALANRTAYLKANLYRLANVAAVTANKILTVADANILQELTATGHITITMPDVTTTTVGDRFPLSSLMTTGKCATISAADTIKYGIGDTRSLMYMYSGERIELISKGTYWLVGSCFGNFDAVGESHHARKLKGNNLVLDGSLVNRADYPRLWEFVQTLTTGQEVVTDANWLAGTGGNVNAYRGCFSLGDGSLTFRLPDERGLFDRSLDLTRGLDTGRIHEYAGGLEEDSIKAHTHDTVVPYVQHTSSAATIGVTDGPPVPALNKTYTSTSTGGTETRPKNIGKIPLIRF